MSDAPVMTLKERKASIGGIGTARKRKEDARFIRGEGNFVDDIKLPGMLHGDFVRSSHAHALIKSIDTEAALAVEGVLAVITAKDREPLGLHWMPTLAGDMAAVLADKKVHFQNQEIAFVVATDRYAATDGIQKVVVEYEALTPLIDPKTALDDDAPIIRDDVAENDEVGQGPRHHPNHIFEWQVGDKEGTDAAFEAADITIREEIAYPRCHPSPIETCGCVASMDATNGKLTVYGTFQAPHVVRTIVSLITSIEENNIRIVSPDVGGGFGNKVGAYPGYICATAASIVTGHPVKWIESRIDNLSTTAFARDYHMTGELAADKDGKILAVRANVLADHGAFNTHAQPMKWPAGLFNIVTGSYDIPVAHVKVDGVFTNKAPGGVAYRCSFRVTEAAYLIERLIDILALKTGVDKAEIRQRNFIQPEQFPYSSCLGWEYDSGDYPTALKQALEAVDYAGLRQEQAEKRERGELMGIGISTFTEIVGAGPVRNCDIVGLGMFDSCEIRVHPTGSIIARLGTKSTGQGHETTFAQIIATELGIPSDNITVEEGDTDTAPYGLGTYGSRSTPVAGAATARAARKIKAKAKKIAAHVLEVAEGDLEWEIDRFKVAGSDVFITMKDIAMAAYSNVPEGMQHGLETVDYYDPPNFTYPFGAYVCVVDIDRFTGDVNVRRFYALDDCGTRINPMVIDGQIHGGLAEAFAIALGQEIVYDETGNVLGASLMDYFLPTAVETPEWETDFTVTPCPHHPIGAKGIGESPNVGGVPAFSNAIIDAFSHFDVTHMPMPHTQGKVWQMLNELGLNK